MNWPERFWAKVQKSDGCWIWTGSQNRKGYGWVGVPGRQTKLAHRVSWVLANGHLDASACVLHRCDTPACVRPDHLFLGSKADNNRDMVSKGRHFRGEARSALQRTTAPRGQNHWTQSRPERIPSGERNGHARLTEATVREILALAGSARSDDLAARMASAEPPSITSWPAERGATSPASASRPKARD
jgi:hypothetical protein